jgi:ribosomal protein S18 acetylase RimI-like enzyme
MQLHLRPAGPADTGVVVEFNRRLARESEGKELNTEILERGVRAVLADPAKGFYTIAEANGEVVGQCLVTFEWSDWRNGWYWWIQSVYVAEQARRSGVFRSLYRHLLDRAQADSDVIGLRLYVEDHNHRAKATYTSLGMELEPYRLMGLYPLPGRSCWIQPSETSPTIMAP